MQTDNLTQWFSKDYKYKTEGIVNDGRHQKENCVILYSRTDIREVVIC
jgi:hypothetical protein